MPHAIRFHILAACAGLLIGAEALSAEVFGNVTIGADAFSRDYPFEYESIGAAPAGNLRLQSFNSVMVHTGPQLAENWEFRADGVLISKGPVPGWAKARPDQRFDIGPLGGTNPENPFWRGLHFTGPTITRNGSNEFPRLALFQESATLADPVALSYTLETGNTAVPVSIHLRTNPGASIALLPGSKRVGVGTQTPLSTVHAAGALSGGVLVDEHDRVGFAATGNYPQLVLMAGGTTNGSHGATIMLGAYDNGTSGDHQHWSIGSAGSNASFLDFGYHHGDDLNPHAGIRGYHGNTIMTMLMNGNVGIGTMAPTEKLSVAGIVRAKELVVETTGWSDYVLAENYPLASLSEVKKHIRQNGTLPGMPSAEEVAQRGIGVGDMQAKLLAKVEELTLHLIRQEAELSELRQEVRALRSGTLYRP